MHGKVRLALHYVGVGACQAYSAFIWLLCLCRYQSDEFLLRAQAGIPDSEIVAAATLNCAELFMKQVRLASHAHVPVHVHVWYGLYFSKCLMHERYSSALCWTHAGAMYGRVLQSLASSCLASPGSFSAPTVSWFLCQFAGPS
jgi:hypothetical protein